MLFRSVCIAFLDLFWMKADCSAECAFVHDADAMSHMLSAKSIPGCDKYVDFETETELEIEGFEKKDPEYKPEVYQQATKEEAEAQAAAQERAHAEAFPTADDAGAAGEVVAKEKEPLEESAFNFNMSGENAPKITVKLENFIRNPDGSIPDYALAEMAAEAEAKAKAEAEATTAATGEIEAESETKIKDEL